MHIGKFNTTFILYYHVVKDDTRPHNGVQILWVPQASRPMQNLPLCLKHSESSLNILSASLLLFCIDRLYIANRGTNALDQSSQIRINPIGKVISKAIGVPVNNKLNRWCV